VGRRRGGEERGGEEHMDSSKLSDSGLGSLTRLPWAWASVIGAGIRHEVGGKNEEQQQQGS